MAKTVLVIDPATRVPEIDCFNNLAGMSPYPLTYHLPVLHGMDTLYRYDADSEIKGIIIFGGGASVHDGQPWQRPLEAWLKPHTDRGVPTIGLCYGHQMLAYMYGGEVGYICDDQTKLTGMRSVHLNGGIWKNGDYELVVSHNEEVKSLPPEMESIGSSIIKIDVLNHKTLPIFGFQSHPEATQAFLKNQSIDWNGDHSIFEDGHAIMRTFLESLD